MDGRGFEERGEGWGEGWVLAITRVPLTVIPAKAGIQ